MHGIQYGLGLGSFTILGRPDATVQGIESGNAMNLVPRLKGQTGWLRYMSDWTYTVPYAQG